MLVRSINKELVLEDGNEIEFEKNNFQKAAYNKQLFLFLLQNVSDICIDNLLALTIRSTEYIYRKHETFYWKTISNFYIII